MACNEKLRPKISALVGTSSTSHCHLQLLASKFVETKVYRELLEKIHIIGACNMNNIWPKQDRKDICTLEAERVIA